MLLGAVIDRVTKKRKTVEIERERAWAHSLCFLCSYS
jgi:hypothetical protein